ncbi:hypothetical protein [Agrobacterium tumefaciens]|uniref:hypothetical protein n=1 Tax=Agrobacterium tumefaciens TaxID=358 RepID=UPI00157470FC|nr:hypothetical protein [Agrobacterium tumefaciens]NTD11758.1 hypothetical protein [Agrobacterium tumefaciens]
MTIEPGTFSEIEQEAIVLSAVVSMVDDMVNHAIFCPLDEKRTDTNLLPQTAGSLRQFGTFLRDFLSPVTGKGARPYHLTCPSRQRMAAKSITQHSTI